MEKKVPIYAAGEFIETNEKLDVFNPYTSKKISTTFLANKDVVKRCIEKAERQKSKLSQLPSYKRYEFLMKIATMIRDDLDEFAQLLSEESAKPLRYSKGEILRAVQTFTIAAEESKRLPKEYISIDWTEAGKNKEGLVKYFPCGIVAGITPFNFPLNLVAHKIAPAIAAGCPIILKPSSETPLSALKLAKIISKCNLPEGAVSILPMNKEARSFLLNSEKIALISFTGSPAVGWNIKYNAAKKKVLLELGGNAGVIISSSADIDKAVDRCVTGAFAYSGQVCIHTQRIFVHNSLFKKFLDIFINKTKLLKQGNPLDESTEISNMIDEENAKRVENWVNEAIKEGAKLLLGGKRKYNFFEPTILTNSKATMKVNCKEVFGPVVTVEAFEDFKEAVNKINDTDYGLQAGVFTNSIDEMNYAFQNIETGAIIINDVPTFRVDNMPYGGIKNSGFGREGVKYCIKEMMEPRLLVKNI